MSLRETNLEKLEKQSFDVLIVGGGINGAVSAASLASRGVKVALIDREDFGSGSSSQSSNLAWGGIKYLESYEFGLVNKLCKSRNHLMRSYPSTVKEIRFLTTIGKGFRYPAFLVYLSTILYWLMGRLATAAPQYFSATQLKAREPRINTQQSQGGFEYSDCYLHDNDSRFVFNFVRTAMDYNCAAVNYVESVDADRDKDQWVTQAKDTLSGRTFTIRSKALINACGPWADQFNQTSEQSTDHSHLFSKGAHLIVDRLVETERVLAFFASDGRLFFVIPMGSKTCIGTTDTQVQQPQAQLTQEDRQFILDNANEMLDLDHPLTTADIISERCGIRPLALKGQENSEADWVKLSRKHAIDLNSREAYLSIFGGKLTDCINVGNEIADLVESLGIKGSHPSHRWYGEAEESTRQEFMLQAQLMSLDEMTAPSSTEPLSTRFWRRYGAHALQLLEEIREDPSRTELMMKNAEYTRGEIEMTARREMITKLEDFLRRRSKIEMVVPRQDILDAPGLKRACEIFFGSEADAKFAEYVADHPA